MLLSTLKSRASARRVLSQESLALLARGWGTAPGDVHGRAQSSCRPCNALTRSRRIRPCWLRQRIRRQYGHEQHARCRWRRRSRGHHRPGRRAGGGAAAATPGAGGSHVASSGLGGTTGAPPGMGGTPPVITGAGGTTAPSTGGGGVPAAAGSGGTSPGTAGASGNGNGTVNGTPNDDWNEMRPGRERSAHQATRRSGLPDPDAHVPA